MAAGYTAFFFYTALIGIAGIVLSFLVAARQPKKTHPSTRARTGERRGA
jgi:PAT family beta-lactamase induction signal transducer AmpG